MDTTIFTSLLLQISLILLNAIFACAEIAVLSVSDTKLAALSAEGNKKAIRLARLTNKPARFLATIQVAITLSGFLGSAFAADHFSDLIVDALLGLGVPVPQHTLDTIAVILITLVLSFFTLVLGELVPKRLAMKKAEKLALGLSGLITFISRLFAPLVWLLTISTNGVLRLLGIDPNSSENDVSEEEIQLLVEAGGQQGIIDPKEQEIIQNIFKMDDLPLSEIATHRTEICLLWLDETAEQWEQTIRESRHTIYPVCDETVDKVVGVLHTRDYFRLPDKSRENVMRHAVKQVFFVPESIAADVLFREMQQSRRHFAVVLDEYGGVTGIVTINDLLELLVGDLDDELSAQAEPPMIERMDTNTWKIRGVAALEEVEEQLGITLPDGEYETFSGLIFDVYGTIPDDGTTFEIDIEPLHIKVLQIQDHRIEQTIVCLLDPPENT